MNSYENFKSTVEEVEGFKDDGSITPVVTQIRHAVGGALRRRNQDRDSIIPQTQAVQTSLAGVQRRREIDSAVLGEALIEEERARQKSRRMLSGEAQSPEQHH